MELTHFDDLLAYAAQQSQPQRLLLVFASVGLPENATDDESRRFADGQGGTLSPIMYVDKLPEEITNFSGLRAESLANGAPWHVMFVAALDGQNGQPAPVDSANHALDMMLKNIQTGEFQRFLAFDNEGDPIRFK